jgi:glycolate oxidase FAD binding subunit
VEVLSSKAGDFIETPEPADWRLLVGFEDNREALNWQVQQLVRELPAGCALEARVGTTAAPWWRELVESARRPSAAVRYKVNLLASALPAFCREAAKLQGDGWLHAHAASGIVRGQLAADQTLDHVRTVISRLRELAARAGGQVVVERCPPAWKQELSVWGPPRGDRAMARRIKQQLDPRGLFNPGRFVDGL